MMRFRFLAAAAFLLAAAMTVQADTLAQWNFNSSPPDDLTSTGSESPSTGAGYASLLGSATASFVAGAAKDSGPDNSAWSLSKFAGINAGNKSTGVQFSLSTLGFENLVISWYQRNSATASRYARLQYSTDGYAFRDASVVAIYKESAWTNQVVDLSDIPGVTNNPNFAFRIVTEFESTATGFASPELYAATKTGSSYSTTGTIHLDLVTVSGTPRYDGNTAPFLFCEIGGQSVRPGQWTAALPFLVLDAEDPAAWLRVDAESSDPVVLPPENLNLGGQGAQRTIRVRGGDQPGTATVTLRVWDLGGKSATAVFPVTVLPGNSPPTLTLPGWTNTLSATPTAWLPFSVGDFETPAGSLSVHARSGNPALLPTEDIAFGGAGSNRTVRLTPAAGELGVAPVTIEVADGTNTVSGQFALAVLPGRDVAVYEPFAYEDGPVTSNSGGYWSRRSGLAGQCSVSGQALRLSSAQSEDVIAPLAWGPYARSNGWVLYASFRLQLLSLPKASSGYFAHFADGSYLRGRIYAGTTNAAANCYRLGVANGIDAPLQLAADLRLDVFYTVVVRYDLDRAVTTLWVDPASEQAPSASGADAQTSVPILAYGFRQDADLGAEMIVDDLRVGTSFAAVTGLGTPATLEANWSGGQVRLSWDDPAWTLQAGPAPYGGFTNVPGAASPWPVNPQGSGAFFRLAK